MKKSLLIIAIAFLASCDKDFEEINTNPTAANDIEPKLLFSTAILQGTGNPYQSEGAILAYASCFVQHFAAITFNWEGDKYTFNSYHNDVMFNDAYRNEVKILTDVIDKVKDDPNQTNLYAAALIWQAVIFQRITDLYGDVPYYEAGKGYLNSNFKPAYDRQQDIYLDLLSKLETATSMLDASKAFIGEADFIYHGDVEKWRRFGNTMMLRMALRLVKADPSTAESWSKKALAGGVMQSSDDSAIVPHSDGDVLVQNGIGYVFAIEDNARLSKTLVDWMKAHNDPRLPVLSFIPAGGEPTGLPHGLDLPLFIEATGDSTDESYSRINPLLVQRNTPTIMQGYAEAEFMLAEVAVRSWNNDDPAQHYENGVRAAMEQLARLDVSASIGSTEIVDYLSANPYAPTSTNEALDFINTQYWAATLLNGLEAFANWRRCGFPVLTPSNYPGNVTGGVIPRRLQYPQAEYSVNGVNINAAIARQGEDGFTTRVWWDK